MIGSNNNNATAKDGKRKHSEMYTSMEQGEYVEVGYDPSLKEKSDLPIDEIFIATCSLKCDSKVKGFGISRLAAQQIAYKYSELGAAVLCDVNVVNSKDVAKGYESEEEEDKQTGKIIRNIYPKAYPIRGTGFYAGSGFGNGIPLRKLEKKEVVRIKGSRGQANRPIEQVVIVGDEMLFDPCFITSSEDMDLSNQLLFEESLFVAKNSLKFSNFKYRPHMDQPPTLTVEGNNYEIAKIEVSHDSLTNDAYMDLRNQYLESLNHENDIKIIYEKKGKAEETTVGELAATIAHKYNLKSIVIRSLIIEKILLEFKSYDRDKAFAECVAYDKKIRKKYKTKSEYWQKVTEDLFKTDAPPSDSESQE